MTNFLGNMAKESVNLSDEVIAKNMISAAAGTAKAYLGALMASTTPEVRAVYASSLNQVIAGQAAVTELAVKREWGNPYMEPREQLSNAYNKSRSIMQQTQQ